MSLFSALPQVEDNDLPNLEIYLSEDLKLLFIYTVMEKSNNPLT